MAGSRVGLFDNFNIPIHRDAQHREDLDAPPQLDAPPPLDAPVPTRRPTKTEPPSTEAPDTAPNAPPPLFARFGGMGSPLTLNIIEC